VQHNRKRSTEASALIMLIYTSNHLTWNGCGPLKGNFMDNGTISVSVGTVQRRKKPEIDR